MPDLEHDRLAVPRTPHRLPLTTPRRLSAASARLRLKHFKARRDCAAMFGTESPLVVAAVADTARVDDATAPNGEPCTPPIARLMQDLAGLGRAVTRLHELLVWSLAACQCIEAEDCSAANTAVHLGCMLDECERINVALLASAHGAEFDDEPGPESGADLAA